MQIVMEDKEGKLIEEICKEVVDLLGAVAEKGSLDHFKLEICNNNGQVQSECTIRNRKRIY